MGLAAHSEDELRVRLDKGIADTIRKTGFGLAIGALCSLLLFKRRMFPILIGTGAGVGFGLAHLQTDLNKPIGK